MLKEAQTDNGKFVKALDELSSKLKDSGNQVLGIVIHLHFANRGLARYREFSKGQNLLEVIGGLECAKEELIREINSRENKA